MRVPTDQTAESPIAEYAYMHYSVYIEAHLAGDFELWHVITFSYGSRCPSLVSTNFLSG